MAEMVEIRGKLLELINYVDHVIHDDQRAIVHNDACKDLNRRKHIEGDE